MNFEKIIIDYKINEIALSILIILLVFSSPWITEDYAIQKTNINTEHIYFVEKNILAVRDFSFYIGGFNIYYYGEQFNWSPSFNAHVVNVDFLGRISGIRKPIGLDSEQEMCRFIGENYNVEIIPINDTQYEWRCKKW